MSDLTSLKILKTWDETSTLRGILLEADGLKKQHTTPGQYLEIVLSPEAKGYFALSNGPDQENFELLLKRGGGTADAIIKLKTGDTVPSKPPAGKGYPLEKHKGKDLLLFAAGSGIAPIRAAAQFIRSHRFDYGDVVLFYGQRFPSDFAYKSDLADLEKQEIQTLLCVSNTMEPVESWKGARGHVQDVFLSRGKRYKDPVAYVCGMKAMVQGVKDAMAKAGYEGERVFQNF